MKKRLLVIALFMGGLVFTSCEVCTTCTEANTGVTSEYCGPKSEVEDFEDSLISTGASVGQDWSCVRD